MTPSAEFVTRAWKPGRLGMASRRTTSAPWVTAKTNSPSGPDETPTDWTPATRPRWRLKLAMLATLTRPTTTTWVVRRRRPRGARVRGARDEAGEARGEGVVADLGISSSLGAGAGDRLGLGGVEVRRQAERREARIGLGLGLVVAHDLDRDVGDGLGAGGRVGRDLGAGGGLGGGLDRGERGLAVDLAVAVGALAVAAASPSSASASVRLGVDGRGLGDGLGVGRRSRRSGDGLGLGRLGDGLGLGLDGLVGLAASARRRASARPAAAASGRRSRRPRGRLGHAPSKGGGSGRFSAIAAKRVGSSSTRRRSKNAAISVSNAATGPGPCRSRAR